MSGLFGDDLQDTQTDALPEPPPSGPGLFGDMDPAPQPKPTGGSTTGAGGSVAAEPAGPHAAAYRVLARKYRPTSFDDLIGQEAMVRILRNAFAQGRVAHAWMLTGVRGVGKTTTARIIARALNCTGPDGTRTVPAADPCGVCPNCVGILADRHPDVLEMDAASRTGVDDVREIIDATRYRPMQARTKVFIVDEVHMLSRNAFNALLKTLEEPPPHVKFVFATTEIRKVPVTVLSRCQRFDLRRVPQGDLAAHFGRIAQKEGVRIAPGALDLIARAADGSVRDGLSLLDQAIAQGEQDAGGGSAASESEAAITAEAVADMLGLAGRTAVFDLMEAVLAGRTADALAVTDRAHERGADLGLLLGDLLELSHTLTRLRAVPGLRDGNELPEAERTRGAALADKLSIPVLGRLWQMLLKGTQEVEAASDRKAAAEMVLIRLCHVAELPTPGEIVRTLQGGAAQQSAQQPAPAAPSGGNGAARSAAGGNGYGARGGGPVGAVARSAAQPAPADPPPWAAQPPQAQAQAQAPRTQAAQAQPALAQPAQVQPTKAEPRLQSFRDVAALVAEQREAILHGHLLHAVHLVRFAPPVIELRPEPAAPRDLASRLAAVLHEATGQRWTIALSQAAGEPTLAQQGQAADAARRDAAAQHPLVRAILDAFPGAELRAVRDARADEYGLLPEGAGDLDAAELDANEPAEPDSDAPADMPEFAPPDAELADTGPH